MKIETKRKILWWVKRVLRYAEYKDSHPFIVTEKKNIIKVCSEHKYPTHEILMIDERQIQFAVNLQLIDELMKNKVIKYTRYSNVDYTMVVATVNVLVP